MHYVGFSALKSQNERGLRPRDSQQNKLDMISYDVQPSLVEG